MTTNTKSAERVRQIEEDIARIDAEEAAGAHRPEWAEYQRAVLRAELAWISEQPSIDAIQGGAAQYAAEMRAVLRRVQATARAAGIAGKPSPDVAAYALTAELATAYAASPEGQTATLDEAQRAVVAMLDAR